MNSIDEKELFDLIHNNKFIENNEFIIDKRKNYNGYLSYTVTLTNYMFQIIRYVGLKNNYNYSMLLSNSLADTDDLIETLKNKTVYKYRKERIDELQG